MYINTRIEHTRETNCSPITILACSVPCPQRNISALQNFFIDHIIHQVIVIVVGKKKKWSSWV